MKKDFSLLKWIIFPAIALGLGTGIGYTSVVMFDWSGSILYLILVALIVAISFVIILQTGNLRLPKAVMAAFAFECVLLVAMLATCIVGIYYSRLVSAARIGNNNAKETITEISKLKSARSQRELVKKAVVVTSEAEIVKQAEMAMLWTLIPEATLSFLALLTLFGINLWHKLKTEGDGTPETPGTPRTPATQPDQVSTESLEAILRMLPKLPAFDSAKPPKKPVYKSVSNGKHSFRFRRLKDNQRIQLSWRGSGQELFCLSLLESEAIAYSQLKYDVLARKVIEQMTILGTDCTPIQESLGV